jgi:hypothetical protein
VALGAPQHQAEREREREREIEREREREREIIALVHGSHWNEDYKERRLNTPLTRDAAGATRIFNARISISREIGLRERERDRERARAREREV